MNNKESIDVTELEEILNSHKWIKVKRYSKPSEVRDWLFQYDLLDLHHREETEFLIEKCRALAKELLEAKKHV